MRNHNEHGPIAGRDAKFIHDGEWARCRLAEITTEGALLDLEKPIGVGERIVACIADVGVIAGTVREASDGRCAIVFQSRPLPADRLAASYVRTQ